MANELKMAIIESILQLRALHWSARQIARELGIDRGTVGKHLRRAQALSKPAISPPGSGTSKPATFPPVPGTRASATESPDSTAHVPEPKPGAHHGKRAHRHVSHRRLVARSIEGSVLWLSEAGSSSSSICSGSPLSG
jgi:DNA-binding transcriptional MocR family regulator